MLTHHAILAALLVARAWASPPETCSLKPAIIDLSRACSSGAPRNNNLAGIGPDTDSPQQIRYEGAVTYDGASFDLVLSSITPIGTDEQSPDYMTVNASRNGCAGTSSNLGRCAHPVLACLSSRPSRYRHLTPLSLLCRISMRTPYAGGPTRELLLTLSVLATGTDTAVMVDFPTELLV